MCNYCILLVWSRLTVTEWAKGNMRSSDWKLRVQNKMGQILSLHSGPLRAALLLESSAHIPQCRHWLGSQSIIATRLESFKEKIYCTFFPELKPFLERFCSWVLNIFRITRRPYIDPLVVFKKKNHWWEPMGRGGTDNLHSHRAAFWNSFLLWVFFSFLSFVFNIYIFTLCFLFF